MNRPWLGIQHWKNPVFIHWPVSFEVLRPLVPRPFQLDTFNGRPWVGIVPFEAVQTDPRWGPGLLSLGPLWQLNIRTYIRFYEEPAVYFLTVYTNSKMSVLGARTLLSLPYEYASFDAHRRHNTIFCTMKQGSQYSTPRFSMDVQPSSESFYPDEHTLEHWLTERYHFYAIKEKAIVKASISHAPWLLQEANHTIIHNNLFAFMTEDRQPLVHIGASLSTYLYPFKIKGRYIK